eukprot:GHRR01012968.1.p1 GENE.GHRR01012968.1~~GHRR01012968.1.p1  ORF type:complete len:153 (+),score=52.07 GHRR01012968.1:452-910(+)
MRSYILIAAAAGALGALAAVLGKASGACSAHPDHAWALTACRLAAFGMMVSVNMAMTALFFKSLQQLPSLQATVIANAANMILTGILGHTVFAEHITGRWMLGVALVISGLQLICKAVTAPNTPTAVGTQQAPQQQQQQQANVQASKGSKAA